VLRPAHPIDYWLGKTEIFIPQNLGIVGVPGIIRSRQQRGHHAPLTVIPSSNNVGIVLPVENDLRTTDRNLQRATALQMERPRALRDNLVMPLFAVIAQMLV